LVVVSVSTRAGIAVVERLVKALAEIAATREQANRTLIVNLVERELRRDDPEARLDPERGRNQRTDLVAIVEAILDRPRTLPILAQAVLLVAEGEESTTAFVETCDLLAEQEPIWLTEPGRVVTTNLSTHHSEWRWISVYEEVRDGSTTAEVRVIDITNMPRRRIDIEFVVHEADLVIGGVIPRGIIKQRLPLLSDGRIHNIFIFVVGPNYGQARSKVSEWLGDDCPVGTFLEGVEDVESLSKQMSMIIQSAIRRIPRRFLDDGRGDLRDPSVGGF
jgi:hypothetical protein